MVKALKRTQPLLGEARSADFPAAAAAPHRSTPAFHTARHQPLSAESFAPGIAKTDFAPASENAYRYWRECLRTSTEAYRNKHGLPELPVKFRDELSDEEESFAVDPDSSGAPPHVVTLDHDSSYHVNRSEYGRLAIHLRQFYDSSGGARVKRTIAAEAGRKGGKKSQENIRKDGKISPEDGRKLTIAAEKAQKKSIIA
jgi:general stress protein YciG